MRWAGHVARLRARRNAYRILVGKPDWKKPLGRPGVDGSVVLKRVFKKRGGGMDWIDLRQDRDRWRAGVNAVMNLRVP